MSEWLSRKSLYDLVWSEPLRTLSSRFGISDVALRKTCQRAMVPTPERGYWARKASGKRTWAIPLPERPPAMDDEIQVGGRQEYWYQGWTDEDLLGPLPPAPQFDTTIESVQERIAKDIGKVTVANKVTWWHPSISRLLKEDEERRRKREASSYVYSWDQPKFESTPERRRLRILNVLFTALGKLHGRPSPDRDAVKSSISFYRQHICIKLAPSPKTSEAVSSSNAGGLNENLTLSILDSYHSERAIHSWSDDEQGKIDGRLKDVAVQIVFLAEAAYRRSVERRFQLRKERKIELEERLRKEKLAAEQTERDRLQRLEKNRIDRLITQAGAFERAAVIRKYVAAIHNANAGIPCTSAEKLEAWSKWALAEADRIDPSLQGRFLESMLESDL